MYQKPPEGTYNPFKISIGGHQLNAVDQFTYLDSVICNNSTVTKDRDHSLSKANSFFVRLQKRMWQNHSLRISTKI